MARLPTLPGLLFFLQLITCPEGVGPGQLIQVAGLSQSMPTVAGVPVSPGGVSRGDAGSIAAGLPVPTHGMHPQAMYGGNGVMLPPEHGYVEVDEISPAGWACLIVGCFACPGLNLLGLCMRERRLIPVSQVRH